MGLTAQSISEDFIDNRINLTPSPVSPKLRTTFYNNNNNNVFIKPALKPVPRNFPPKDDIQTPNFGAKLFVRKSPVPSPRLSDIFQMIRLGDIETLDYWLCQRKFNLDAYHSILATTPLLLAIQYKHLDIVKSIIKHGCDVNRTKVSNEGLDIMPPLISAIKYGHLDIFKYLLTVPEIQIEIEYKQKSAIEWTLEYNRPMHMAELSKSGVKLPKFVLHDAIKKNGYVGGQEMAFLLLQYGADITQVDIEGSTPLELAVYVGNKELVKSLLGAGSNPWKVKESVLRNTESDIRELILDARKSCTSLQNLSRNKIISVLNRKSGGVINNLAKLPLPHKFKHLNLM